jgi:hypothetical protein
MPPRILTIASLLVLSPDSGTVEGHQKAMAEAAETRQYNRMMKELTAKREAGGSLTSRLLERIARKLRFQRD